jgi:hypothetical protein
MEKLSLNPDHINSDRIQPAPETTAFDYAIEVAKLGTLAFPFLGTGVALFTAITGPLRGKRLNEWLEQLRLQLNELSQKVAGLTPERLASDEAFNSAFAHAAQAASRAHQEQKLEALRNAILNVAVGKAPSDDLQLVFLNFVDSFSPTHLQILALFSSRDRSGRAAFRDQQDLTDQVVRDLRDRGLLRDTRAYIAQNRESTDPLVIWDWEATNLGRRFLDFVTSPLQRS